MKRFVLSMALAGVLFNPVVGAEESVDVEAKLATYRATVKEFGHALKKELATAIKSEGGPVSAITVCNEKAPQIATQFTAEKGFNVARTSLKYRNVDNKPDLWETGALMAFEERLKAGEDPKTMETHAVIEENGQRKLRYMKAVPTVNLCLTCHGGQIPEDVQTKLTELYPEDKAIGYEKGQIRGAFTFTEILGDASK